MKELQPDLLNDYEHLITRGIERHGEVPGFPKMEDAGIERKELDDFLFEVQSALDSQGSQKALWPSCRCSSSVLFPKPCSPEVNIRCMWP